MAGLWQSVMTGGKIRAFAARLALCSTAVLATAGAMGTGHAEPIGDLPGHFAFAPALDGTLASAASVAGTSVRDRVGPFAQDAAQLAPPEHAVDILTSEPVPEAEDLGTGIASYYGKRFAGRPTANGESFDPQLLTAAHRTLPFGSKVRVTNPRNGKSVVVRINDRGPFVRGRHIDLSRRAAEQIGIVKAGHGKVELELLLS